MEVFGPGVPEPAARMLYDGPTLVWILHDGVLQKVHASLVESVVDFQDHGPQFLVFIVKVPEGDWIEGITKESRGRDQVGEGEIIDIFTL